MRRLLSSIAGAAIAITAVGAQTPTGSEGSLFLLLPTGAQAVGMGQAMVAIKPGSEGIWWNPASIGEQSQRELAIHHSKTVAGVGDALSFVLPAHSYGVTAFSLNILNIGEQQVTGRADHGRLNHIQYTSKGNSYAARRPAGQIHLAGWSVVPAVQAMYRTASPA